MTVLGKILVFVNLVFSFVTCGLIIMVYTTRVNWNAAYTAQTAALANVRRDADADQKAASDQIARLKADIDRGNTERTKIQSERDGLATQLAAAKAEYTTLQTTQGTGQQVIKDQQAELARRKTEVDNLKKLVDDRDKKIADIDRQMALLRDAATNFRTQWDRSKEQNGILRTQIESLTQENAKLRQQPGVGTSGATTTVAAPRVEDLRGTIQRVDGDLATITPGSDAGVAVGARLQVFHLHPKPDYLGELTILSVTPTEAVGRLTGPRARQVKKGDEVAANLGH
jgi:hypothetical protein